MYWLHALGRHWALQYCNAGGFRRPWPYYKITWWRGYEHSNDPTEIWPAASATFRRGTRSSWKRSYKISKRF